MSGFIKHVGKHNQRKCIILYRKVPGEDHMCLIVYPDMLQQHVHDTIMEALESAPGQNEKTFADYLFRVTLPDGENALTTLHNKNWIKKVPCNQVVVTPNIKSSVRLDVLNETMDKIELGEQGIKDMAELDAGKRMPDGDGSANELRPPPNSRSTPAKVDSNLNIGDVLTDEQIAQQRLAQSQKMQMEAKQLLAESERLAREAQELLGTTDGRKKTKKTKVAEGQS